MPYSYVCRVTLPSSEFIDVVKEWAEKSDQLLVYEHEADEKVSKTHLHFLIVNSYVRSEQLKRIAREAFPDLKGNEHWSWKEYDPSQRKSYISYMTKGKLSCIFNKNISLDELESSRLAWVEPVLGNDKHPGLSKKHDDVHELYQSFIKKYDVNESQYHNGYQDSISERILALCRTHTMSHIYHKTGKLPFPGTYKQIAGTLFLRVIENQRPDYFEQALDTLKNLWY